MFLLISLQYDLENIGIKYLHGTLHGKGYDSSILYLPHLDVNDNIQMKNIFSFISKLKPAVIGISVMSTDFNNASELTSYLKEKFAETVFIWGGIHPTLAPDACIQFADYVCVGEGENTLLDVAAAVNDKTRFEDIPNLCYRKDGRTVKNSLHPLIEELDDIPIVDHIPKNSYIQIIEEIEPITAKKFNKFVRHSGRVYNILSARGCPFSCTYCCNNAIVNLYGSRKIRKRSIHSIISELQKAVKENSEIEYIAIQDDCFLANNIDNLSEFSFQYKEKIAKPFMIRSIPIYVTKEKINILKDSGLSWINVGLQSGSDRICKEVFKRKSLKSDFLSAARILHENKIAGFYDIITDNPFETDQDRLDTIHTMMETPKPFYPQIFSLVLYFGTEIFEMVNQFESGSNEDYLNKNYLVYKNDIHNDMIRMASFTNKRLMALILKMYLHNPDSALFKIMFKTIKLFTLFVIEPITYFRLIKMTQGDSYLRTIKILPAYFHEGIKRYLKQFNCDFNS